jgi:hypothetical protein
MHGAQLSRHGPAGHALPWPGRACVRGALGGQLQRAHSLSRLFFFSSSQTGVRACLRRCSGRRSGGSSPRWCCVRACVRACVANLRVRVERWPSVSSLSSLCSPLITLRSLSLCLSTLIHLLRSCSWCRSLLVRCPGSPFYPPASGFRGSGKGAPCFMQPWFRSHRLRPLPTSPSSSAPPPVAFHPTHATRTPANSESNSRSHGDTHTPFLLGSLLDKELTQHRTRQRKKKKKRSHFSPKNGRDRGAGLLLRRAPP